MPLRNPFSRRPDGWKTEAGEKLHDGAPEALTASTDIDTNQPGVMRHELGHTLGAHGAGGSTLLGDDDAPNAIGEGASDVLAYSGESGGLNEAITAEDDWEAPNV